MHYWCCCGWIANGMKMMTYFIKSVVPFIFQMTVDMLNFLVIIVRIIDEITVDYEVDDINLVKVLIYVACERYFNMIAMCNYYHFYGNTLV